jgi:4'-phosphopantetheinyl transferase EntD
MIIHRGAAREHAASTYRLNQDQLGPNKRKDALDDESVAAAQLPARQSEHVDERGQAVAHQVLALVGHRGRRGELPGQRRGQH